MKDKLRELAERWKGAGCRNGSSHECADELLAILDAEGDGGVVGVWTDQNIDPTAYSYAAGVMGTCPEGPTDGALKRAIASYLNHSKSQPHPTRPVVVSEPPQPARSVSDEDVNSFLDEYEGKRAHPRSFAHIENARACLIHFAAIAQEKQS